jgi:hypothetical protein
VTIIYRNIFLRFWLKTHFASTKFCVLYAEMVQGRQILKFYTTMVHIANDCGYKILRFWANPQKYQTLVPAKNSHLKVITVILCAFYVVGKFMTLCLYQYSSITFLVISYNLNNYVHLLVLSFNSGVSVSAVVYNLKICRHPHS